MNKNNSKINIDKIRDSFQCEARCETCNNCAIYECTCSCHLHKRKSSSNLNNFNYKYEDTYNKETAGDRSEDDITLNKNYDKNIYENIGTNIQKRILLKSESNIDNDLSKNLDDLSQYYRNIYSKTKLELDLEKGKGFSLAQNKEKHKTKLRDLLNDKSILLEKIKNLSLQLDRVITMLHEITTQKKSLEKEYNAFKTSQLNELRNKNQDEISEITKKLKI